MKKKNTWAIIGAGNAGFALAGQLALQGEKVNLYNRTFEVVNSLKKAGGIYLKGILQGFAPLHMITNNIEEAIKNADIIMITTPATAHLDLAKLLSPYLEEGQVIILNPGRTGGAFEFKNILHKYNNDKEIIIAEAQTFIYASRKTGPAHAYIYAMKNSIPMAALPSNRTEETMEKIGTAIPQFKGVGSVLETSLNNIGAILHPIPMLLNLGRIEAIGDFSYYHEGITPTVAKVLDIVDKERLGVARAFGVTAITLSDWLKTAYGVSEGDLYEAIQGNIQYEGLMAPQGIKHRYILEDVPTGLVPYSYLARVAGITTPTINMVINLANTITGRNFWYAGRTLKKMGLFGFSQQDIIDYATIGFSKRAHVCQNMNCRDKTRNIPKVGT